MGGRKKGSETPKIDSRFLWVNFCIIRTLTFSILLSSRTISPVSFSFFPFTFSVERSVSFHSDLRLFLFRCYFSLSFSASLSPLQVCCHFRSSFLSFLVLVHLYGGQSAGSQSPPLCKVTLQASHRLCSVRCEWFWVFLYPLFPCVSVLSL